MAFDEPVDQVRCWDGYQKDRDDEERGKCAAKRDSAGIEEDHRAHGTRNQNEHEQRDGPGDMESNAWQERPTVGNERTPIRGVKRIATLRTTVVLEAAQFISAVFAAHRTKCTRTARRLDKRGVAGETSPAQ